MAKEKPAIFDKSLFAVAGVIAMSIFLYSRSQKEKKDFYHTTGKIVSLNKWPTSDTSHFSKMRYLTLSSYPKRFDLFVGKERGDFSPEYENIEALKVGDLITIHYDENERTKDEPSVSLVYFVDKDRTSYYRNGSWEKWAAYLLGGLGVALVALLMVLKNKGKIE